MEENINVSERIDRYILGQMNDVERQAFEADMASDPDLRKDYELQREIALAVQRVHLKRHMQDIECKAKINRRKKIRRLASWSIAAAIACFCLVGVEVKWSLDLTCASILCYAATEAPISGSDDDIEQLIATAYQYIGEDKLNAAEANLDIAYKEIQSQLRNTPATDKDEYRREILLLQKEDVEWYRALILMNKGKIFKSRKAFQSIVESDGRYADEARKILETNYPF